MKEKLGMPDNTVFDETQNELIELYRKDIAEAVAKVVESYIAPPKQLCPVCKGRCSVPADFYNPPIAGTTASGSFMGTVTCKSCGGSGVI